MADDRTPVRSFLRELKRRKVFRVAIVYAVAGWGVIQVADATFPRLQLPEWTVTFVIALVGLGFPVALVVAWAFEVAPEGVRRTRAVEPRRGTDPAGSGAGGPAATLRSREGESAPVDDPPAQRSIAVLPFADLSPEGDQGYFADGLAEELLNALTKIEGLRVAARTSSFALGNTNLDVREVAEKLGVAHVVEGSVRKAGERLRLTAQLVNAEDGYHLWSETYDRELEEVFAVQEEIARSITEALRVTLEERERHAIERAPEAELEAYDFYLRGRHYLNRLHGESVRHARRLFVRAVEVDPEYARAHSGLADASSFLHMYWEKDPEHLETADSASRRAVELAPELAEAHVSRGLALSLRGEHDRAEEAFETAIDLDPTLFDAFYFFGRSRWAAGELEEAAGLFERAIEVRPEDFQARVLLSNVYGGLERPDEERAAMEGALKAVETHLELHPDDTRATYMAGACHAELGHREEARSYAERAIAMDPEDAGVRYNVACIEVRLGEPEGALDSLERAVDLGFAHREWVENDPDLGPLRAHPRFQDLLERLG